MSTKLRSILLLIAIFIMGNASGFFVRGLYDHYRWEKAHQHRHSDDKHEKSRFVGFFTWVIKPTPAQSPSVEALLDKWDVKMKELQKSFGTQSEERFKEMVAELSPLLNPEQMKRLKEALEDFGGQRRRSSSNKSTDRQHLP